MGDEFKDQSIVVVGATGGVGSDLVRLLSKKGARVAAVARRQDVLATLCLETGAHAIAIENGGFEAIENAMKQASEHFGGELTGAVCCAGSLILKPAHLTSEQELRDCLDANVISAFGVLRSAAKLMSAKQGGSIVLVSSAAAKIGLPNHEAIAAAKGAISSLVLSAAATYARFKIRVNAVAPGLVETPLTAKITSSEVALKASVAMHPIGRIGEPGDISSAISFLLSLDSTWITGQTIIVDGGLSSLKGK